MTTRTKNLDPLAGYKTGITAIALVLLSVGWWLGKITLPDMLGALPVLLGILGWALGKKIERTR